jgi:spore coat polysaccharide biosynthesis protein SpsF
MTQTNFMTEQEAFWAGDFGKEYTNRNDGDKLIATNIAFFSKALQMADSIGSVMEFGCNLGLNLKAIRQLLPEAELAGIEINKLAAEKLASELDAEVINDSMLDYTPEKSYDLTLIKTVLIHINPDLLPQVYDKLYATSNKYILVCEYYNPTPTEVVYRGHEGKLFKRDFAGDMLDRFPDRDLVDYGFCYHRDKNFPQDDISWFLLKKL